MDKELTLSTFHFIKNRSRGYCKVIIFLITPESLHERPFKKEENFTENSNPSLSCQGITKLCRLNHEQAVSLKFISTSVWQTPEQINCGSKHHQRLLANKYKSPTNTSILKQAPSKHRLCCKRNCAEPKLLFLTCYPVTLSWHVSMSWKMHSGTFCQIKIPFVSVKCAASSSPVEKQWWGLMCLDDITHTFSTAQFAVTHPQQASGNVPVTQALAEFLHQNAPCPFACPTPHFILFNLWILC